MTEISFYHLTASPLERVLPRLLVKVLENGGRAVVLGQDEARLKLLNDQLWTTTKTFIPHGMKSEGQPERQPVYLTLEEENPNQANFLVLVDGRETAYIGEFERCMDMFDGGDEEAVKQARARWKRLKDAGHTLTYWQQDEKGSWQKAG
ncbi:MAG: DNA polymerase III subunit chi [Hyphomicrobiales bacterium]|nr:DNA polymerase III subunit chi [Rickettsiales bacterium]MCP5361787.1 DNA polymerase III subunit chi [Hyphomicrobiales bacterium]